MYIFNAELWLTQQKRDVEVMLDYCWTTVCDAGLTIIQNCLKFPCLMGNTTGTF